MKTHDPMSPQLRMPTFKALWPEPLDSPIYRHGYLVGAVVLGGKSPSTSRRASALEKGARP